MKGTYQELCTYYEGSRRTALINQLETHYDWPLVKAERALTQYLMFLYIASHHPGTQLVPTDEIDCVWETDILQDTAQYIQTCKSFCGEVIHHVGVVTVRTSTKASVTQQAFETTQLLFQRHFGQEVFAEQPLHIAACGVL